MADINQKNMVFKNSSLYQMVRNFINLFRWLIKKLFCSLKSYLYNKWITHFPFNFVRLFYLRKILKIRIGKYSFVHMGAWFQGNIRIGNNTVIGRNVVLMGEIIIENNVSISAETYLCSLTHCE